MFTKTVAAALALALGSTSVLAADLRGAVEKAGRVAAAQDAADRGPMPRVYKWVGIGLVIEGAGTAITGALMSDMSSCQEVYGREGCKTVTAAYIGLGVASIGTGVAMLIVGNRKRYMPEVTPARGGWAVSKGIRF